MTKQELELVRIFRDNVAAEPTDDTNETIWRVIKILEVQQPGFMKALKSANSRSKKLAVSVVSRRLRRQV